MPVWDMYDGGEIGGRTFQHYFALVAGKALGFFAYAFNRPT